MLIGLQGAILVMIADLQRLLRDGRPEPVVGGAVLP
jgi:hypothetical protein